MSGVECISSYMFRLQLVVRPLTQVKSSDAVNIVVDDGVTCDLNDIRFSCLMFCQLIGCSLISAVIQSFDLFEREKKNLSSETRGVA